MKLPESSRVAYGITIRWFLSHCKRAGRPADIEQARAFVEQARAEKAPSDWVLQRWKDAVNWFFREAPKADSYAPISGASSVEDRRTTGYAAKASVLADSDKRGNADDRSDSSGAGTRGPVGSSARLDGSEPEWKLKFIKGIRIRQFAYETEKAYLNWLERFVRYWKTNDLEALGENEIKLYLDHLAVKERVAGGTQRQALNALVFLFRDVFKRELGDFSDYKKASSTKRIPVVLSEEEIRRMLTEMEPQHAF